MIAKKDIRNIVETINREERRKAFKIVNSLKVGSIVKSGNGYINKVINRDETSITFKALRGNRERKLQVKTIKDMVAYFYRVRIAERKELEVFHSYNSLLFSILKELFHHCTRMSKVRNLLRLVMIGVRVFFAGRENSKRDMEYIIEHGANHILFSYYWLRGKKNGRGKRAWKERITKYNLRCLLDCGKFSEWSAKQKGKAIKDPLNIDKYIEFIKENIELFEGYFVFDEIGNHKKTMENLKYMQSKGLNPVPVFHMGTDIKVLDKLVDAGYEVIGLGGTVNQPNVDDFLSRVFDKYPNIAFHGLGITNADYLLKYPFFSCDSSAWINCRRKNKIFTFRGQVVNLEEPWEFCLEKSTKFLTSLENSDAYMTYSMKKYLIA